MTTPNPTTTAPLESLGTICRAADGSYEVLDMGEAELVRFLAFMIAKQQDATTRVAGVAQPLESAAIDQAKEQGDACKGEEEERDPKGQLDDHHQAASSSSAVASSSTVTTLSTTATMATNSATAAGTVTVSATATESVTNSANAASTATDSSTATETIPDSANAAGMITDSANAAGTVTHSSSAAETVANSVGESPGSHSTGATASAKITNDSMALTIGHSNLPTHTSSAVGSSADLADLFANLTVAPPPTPSAPLLLLDGYLRYFQEVSLMHVTLNQHSMLSIHASRQILPRKRSDSPTGNWCTIALYDPTTMWSGDWPVAWASIHGPGDHIEDNSVYAVPVHDYALNDPNPGSWAVTTPLRAVDMNPENFAWFCFVPESKWPQVNVIGVPRERDDLIYQFRQETSVHPNPGMISHGGLRRPFARLVRNGFNRDLFCPLVYDATMRRWVMDQDNQYFRVVKLGLVETPIQLDVQQSRWHRVTNAKGSKVWRIGR
ncbi:hypothetical protein AMAG_05139 [Allomyces macrogynus ATCC 38327]|uniref:Uncharacterized protein n=1 Tax=Allomyces macrogynus (strain ATCC 38327) TaxID=578462 RepID=A0A0L0SB98_ALLM3|nr:hypothetical protein AMAG_05139 [Allomyces macrogynus ATCC 38327]|eukprot:KNE59665.1 hypothetical protein AMAG_05139 [Allomyces macrogynus ATCC 38327]